MTKYIGQFPVTGTSNLKEEKGLFKLTVSLCSVHGQLDPRRKGHNRIHGTEKLLIHENQGAKRKQELGKRIHTMPPITHLQLPNRAFSY